jgi:hypothetical protein
VIACGGDIDSAGADTSERRFVGVEDGDGVELGASIAICGVEAARGAGVADNAI